jgi:hypothetical protein
MRHLLRRSLAFSVPVFIRAESIASCIWIRAKEQQMDEELPARTKLARGQVLHFHAPGGTMIAAAEGAVSVRPAPTWIGEQLMQEKSDLAEGEAHRIRQSGWVAVLALSDAEIICSRESEHALPQVTSLFTLVAVYLRRMRLGLRGSGG